MISQLPAEVYNQIIKYLSNNDIKNISQCNQELRKTFQSFKWQNTLVFLFFEDSNKKAYKHSNLKSLTNTFQLSVYAPYNFPRYSPIPWKVFISPHRYSWFSNENVKTIVLNSVGCFFTKLNFSDLYPSNYPYLSTIRLSYAEYPVHICDLSRLKNDDFLFSLDKFFQNTTHSTAITTLKNNFRLKFFGSSISSARDFTFAMMALSYVTTLHLSRIPVNDTFYSHNLQAPSLQHLTLRDIEFKFAINILKKLTQFPMLSTVVYELRSTTWTTTNLITFSSLLESIVIPLKEFKLAMFKLIEPIDIIPLTGISFKSITTFNLTLNDLPEDQNSHLFFKKITFPDITSLMLCNIDLNSMIFDFPSSNITYLELRCSFNLVSFDAILSLKNLKKIYFNFTETPVVRDYDFLSCPFLDNKEKFNSAFLREKEEFIKNICWDSDRSFNPEFLIKLFDIIFFSENPMASLVYKDDISFCYPLLSIVYYECIYYSIMSSKISFIALDMGISYSSPWMARTLANSTHLVQAYILNPRKYLLSDFDYSIQSPRGILYDVMHKRKFHQKTLCKSDFDIDINDISETDFEGWI